MAAHFNSYDEAAVASWASQILKSSTTMLARNAYNSSTSLPVPNIPNRNMLSSNASTDTADNVGTSFRTRRDQTPYPGTAYRQNTLSSNGFTNSGDDIGTPVNAQREDTPFPSHAYHSSSSSGSSSALSDAPDSDLDEAPRLSRPGSFTSLRNALSTDLSNQPALSRRASALSLPDAPPLNPSTPARRSSMSKTGTNSEKLRLNVSFDLSRSTQLPPPPVEIALLPNAYSRSKTFILSYADINGMTDANRPKQCRPMFALLPPPYLSAKEKKDYGKFLQRLVDALNLPDDANRGIKDRAPRARRALWHLWFVSRDEWLYLGQPDVDFEGDLTWLAYNRGRHCHLNEDGSVYTG